MRRLAAPDLDLDPAIDGAAARGLAAGGQAPAGAHGGAESRSRMRRELRFLIALVVARRERP